MQVKLECFKCAVAFFFLFFLHGTSIGNGLQGISYNMFIKQLDEKLHDLGVIEMKIAQLKIDNQ